MEIVVCVIMGIAVVGLLGAMTFTGLLLSQVVKMLRVAASMPPQPSRDRRSRRQELRQEPQHESQQESVAAGALRRRKHEEGEA